MKFKILFLTFLVASKLTLPMQNSNDLFNIDGCPNASFVQPQVPQKSRPFFDEKHLRELFGDFDGDDKSSCTNGLTPSPIAPERKPPLTPLTPASIAAYFQNRRDNPKNHNTY